MILENNIVAEYDNLLEQIEAKNKRLEQEHSSYINCKRGCSSCCISFKIVPVEKYIIHKKLVDNGIDIASFVSKKGECRFLQNNECAIHRFRPVMCRTHGFPLLYLDEEEVAYEFSSCDLNFIDFDLDEVSEANCIMMDDYNYVINQLNIQFLDVNETIKKTTDLLVSF